MTTTTMDTYGYAVPNQPKTPSRSVRVDDPEWEAADAVTARLDRDRSKEMQAYWDWYFHKPGVDLARPPLEFVERVVAEELTATERRVEQAANGKERGKLVRRTEALREMAKRIRDRAGGA